MSSSFHPEIIEQFHSAARACGLTEQAQAYHTHYNQKIKRQFDAMDVHRIDLSNTKSIFDIAWLFIPFPRPNNKRSGNRKTTVLIAGVDTAKGRIILLSGENLLKHIEKMHQTPDRLARTLAQRGNVADQPDSYSIQSSYSFLTKLLERSVTRASYKAGQPGSRPGPGKPPYNLETRRRLRVLLKNSTKSVIKKRLNETYQEIDRRLNHDAMAFAETFNSWSYKEFDKHHPPIEIYNLLVSASGPRAMEYRKGALHVLAPLKFLFLNEDTFWQEIDRGTPIFTALGQHFKVKPLTCKHLTRRATLFDKQASRSEDVRYFDKIDPSRWPASEEELRIFNRALKAAKIYAEAFDRDPTDVLAQWAKECWRKGGATWQQLLRHQLDKNIKQKIAEALKRSGYEHEANVPAEFLSEIEQGTRFWDDCIELYRAGLGNIAHMKSDIILKLVRPAIMLNLEARGLALSNSHAIEEFEKKISARLWCNMWPSEQIAASSYWHSPNINFNNRFRSIAYSRDQSWSWHSLTVKPIEAMGLMLHPLTTTLALKEEGDAMHHCVWGYTYSCMKYNYHIFSLRDANGRRQSTLTVQDYYESNGVRKIKLIEHRRKQNRSIQGGEAASADHFIKAVNKGDIRPDWQAVDESRVAFLAQELDNSVGYDFRVPEQRQRIFDLYEPCLPRSLSSRGNRNFDGFCEVLGIHTLIDDFLAARDPAAGGLVRATLTIRDAQLHGPDFG